VRHRRAPRAVWLPAAGSAAISIALVPVSIVQVIGMGSPVDIPTMLLSLLPVFTVLSALLALLGVHLATREEIATMGEQDAARALDPQDATVGGDNG